MNTFVANHPDVKPNDDRINKYEKSPNMTGVECGIITPNGDRTITEINEEDRVDTVAKQKQRNEYGSGVDK